MDDILNDPTMLAVLFILIIVGMSSAVFILVKPNRRCAIHGIRMETEYHFEDTMMPMDVGSLSRSLYCPECRSVEKEWKCWR